MSSGEITDVVPVVRSAIGLGYEIHRRTTVGVSVTYDWVFAGDSVSVPIGGSRDEVTVFDDTVHFAAGVDYYF